MKLGENLRKLRLKAKLRQEDLEQISGVTQSAISLIESGKTKSPSAWTIERLCAALKVSTSDILGTKLPRRHLAVRAPQFRG